MELKNMAFNLLFLLSLTLFSIHSNFILFSKIGIFYFLLFFLIFSGVDLFYNVVLVSGVKQSKLPVYQQWIYIYPLFFIFFRFFFSYRPLQSIDQSSLCFIVGPYYLSILCGSVYMSISVSHSLVAISFFFYICDSIAVLQKSSLVQFFFFLVPCISDIIQCLSFSV